VVILERDAHKAFQPLHPYQNGCNLCLAKFPYQVSLDILRAIADVYLGLQLLQRMLVLVERSIFDVRSADCCEPGIAGLSLFKAITKSCQEVVGG
jgi:hypothetical protein